MFRDEASTRRRTTLGCSTRKEVQDPSLQSLLFLVEFALPAMKFLVIAVRSASTVSPEFLSHPRLPMCTLIKGSITTCLASSWALESRGTTASPLETSSPTMSECVRSLICQTTPSRSTSCRTMCTSQPQPQSHPSQTRGHVSK